MRAIKVLERVLATIPIMFGVAIIVFIFIWLTPGDPDVQRRPMQP